MGQKHTFRAVIESAGKGGAFVTVPFDVEQAFRKKRVKASADIEGVLYRGSLVRMGGPCHILGIRKDIREQIRKDIGDEIEVTVEEDVELREVAVPQDVALALTDSPEAEAFFQQLSYSHQREYVQWIEEAKRDETRQKRIGQMVELLKQGKRGR